MSIRQSISKIAISTVALIALSSVAQAEFCSKYQQTHSNAGQCNNCFLNISSIANGHYYTVLASNGWSAELRSTHGDTSVASGVGKWRADVGHAYAGTKFTIDLEQQGSQLSMMMDGNANGQRQIIRARFRCIQR
ncbi:hypothetical protein [Roseibium sediminicola]|uniref:Uncharacterized protein n=1 Tax=Roseibium sediminicola TaxID=2933272 RepID=A0ABT0H1P0_9HYPH|nr:hypothetical protein [Roseibium sp. CAU 1639]MCK7615521.1 hypothetical protein [Roseibium sp. CAU 1639]